MRREPIEVRKATLRSILRTAKARYGVRLNEHLEQPRGRVGVFSTPAKWGSKGIVSKRLGSALPIRTFAGLAQV